MRKMNPRQLLIETAVRVVAKVYDENGPPRHGKDDWLEFSPEEHLQHAAQHLEDDEMIRRGLVSPNGENHLFNAMCRIAMALVVEDKVTECQSNALDCVTRDSCDCPVRYPGRD